MNDRPTPETDAFFSTFANGEATPIHAEYYDRMTKLERERDDALEQLAKWQQMKIESDITCHYLKRFYRARI